MGFQKLCNDFTFVTWSPIMHKYEIFHAPRTFFISPILQLRQQARFKDSFVLLLPHCTINNLQPTRSINPNHDLSWMFHSLLDTFDIKSLPRPSTNVLGRLISALDDRFITEHDLMKI